MHRHDPPPVSPSRADNSEQVERLLAEAAHELPPVSLAGCLVVGAEVIPISAMRLYPMCAHVSASQGLHQIPTQFVWKDLETLETYCHLQCAALEAIERAVRIADIEQLAANS